MGARVRAASKAGGLKQTISAVTLPKLIDTTPSEALDQNLHAPLRGLSAKWRAAEGFRAARSSSDPQRHSCRFDRLLIEAAEMSAEIKRIAKLFGADLCAVIGFDERWVHASRFDVREFSEAPNDLTGADQIRNRAPS